MKTKTEISSFLRNKKRIAFLNFVRTLIEALVIALVIRTFLFQPFNIPSGSMKPTLLVGDYLFVSKYSYGYSKHAFPFSYAPFEGRFWATAPKRGEVAVFKLPSDPSKDYVKRVIGLPGEKLQVLKGRLYINGQQVKREQIPDPDAKDRRERRYFETLPGGRKHLIIESKGDFGYWDNTKVYVVPEGHYFMMGDNRDNSLDSRSQVGFVPFENFVGRAEIIFFSISGENSPLAVWRWPFDLRMGRFFTMIR